MFAAFNQFFATITSFFAMLNYFARAGERIGELADVKASTWVDEQKSIYNRQASLLEREAKITAKAKATA